MTKTIAATAIFGFVQTTILAQTQIDQRQEKLLLEAQGKLMTVFYSENSAEIGIPDAPFSAEETNTTTQTLFDGNRIVNGSTTRVYRDQQGRTRVERTLSNIGPLAAGQAAVSITINDPVSKTRYTLDPDTRTAYKSDARLLSNVDAIKEKLAAEAADMKVRMRTVPDAAATMTYSPMQKSERAAKVEDLGTSNMAGVQVKGKRTTLLIPAGAMGNDREIGIVDERWYSPELQMNIMTKHTDPRMGETVFQVNNLTRTNPDPALFQVPADYQVKQGEKASPNFKFLAK